jgi:hypothetical protein
MTEIPTVWPTIGWPHEKPEQQLSITAAHLDMQRHRSCSREHCARKRAAWQTLVDARRITPDSGRIR